MTGDAGGGDGGRWRENGYRPPNIWDEIYRLRADQAQMRRDLDAALARLQLLGALALFIIGSVIPVMILLWDRFTG